MPIIAFIGVRISWLIVGEERALGLVRRLGRRASLLGLAEQPRVLDRDHGLVGERLRAAPAPCRERAGSGAHYVTAPMGVSQSIGAHAQRAKALTGGEVSRAQAAGVASTDVGIATIRRVGSPRPVSFAAPGAAGRYARTASTTEPRKRRVDHPSSSTHDMPELRVESASSRSTIVSNTGCSGRPIR